MRKLCVVMLAIGLLAPTAAASAERAAPGDGSLVVSNANGRLYVSGSGVIFGHLDSGSITVVGDYKPDDNSALPTVSGATVKVRGHNLVYAGTDVRFLFPSGRYTLVVDGIGIDISAVGKGQLAAVGAGFPDDGSYAADGGKPAAIDSLGVATFGNTSFGPGKGVAVASSGRGK